MQFLYPSFLWGLLVLAIPIIIHLFYFRRFKKVMFTNVKFLKEIKDETSSRNKLKNLLILAMRCLAVAALVFAFAQPYISKTKDIKKGEKAISLFIDNSSSMNAERENIPLLEIAKSKARDIVKAYEEEDQFQILTHDFEGRHQRLVSKDDALGLIDEVNITPEVKTLSRAINRQKQVLKKDENIIYILSDFQKTITDIENVVDTSIELNLLPIQSIQEKNISIDTAYFESPVPILNQTNNLIIKVSNRSNIIAERVKISFQKDGQTKPIGVKDIAANSTITDTVAISVIRPGFHEGIVKVNDFPIQFDDELYISFYVDEEVKVLSLNEGTGNRYLNALFSGLSYFSLTNQDLRQIQFQTFPDYDLILLNDIRSISSGLSNELQQYINNGGKVIVFPSINAELNTYNSFLGQTGGTTLKSLLKADKQVSKINTDEFIFNDVFENLRSNIKLPNTKQNFELTTFQRTAQDVILSYRDNKPYLIKNNVGQGFLYLCTAPLNQDINDLVLNAEIFVPMLYKMALATGVPKPLSYWIGQDNLIQIPNESTAGEKVYKINGPAEFIPGVTNYGKSVLLDINDQVQKAGFYKLLLDDNEIRSLAFNYDRRESDLAIYNADELSSTLKNSNVNIIEASKQDQLNEIVIEKDRGIVLWKWFIIATLLFLLLEIVFIRLLKN